MPGNDANGLAEPRRNWARAFLNQVFAEGGARKPELPNPYHPPGGWDGLATPFAIDAGTIPHSSFRRLARTRFFSMDAKSAERFPVDLAQGGKPQRAWVLNGFLDFPNNLRMLGNERLPTRHIAFNRADSPRLLVVTRTDIPSIALGLEDDRYGGQPNHAAFNHAGARPLGRNSG